jgi:hypothetical protein
MKKNITIETTNNTSEMNTEDLLNEIIDTSECTTLYSTLYAECFPCFAALMSAGINFPDLKCKVDLKPYKKNGVSLYFSYKFDGFGEYIPMETMHIERLEKELEAWILTEVSYACVKDIPEFYSSLISTLPYGESAIEQLGQLLDIFYDIFDIA